MADEKTPVSPIKVPQTTSGAVKIANEISETAKTQTVQTSSTTFDVPHLGDHSRHPYIELTEIALDRSMNTVLTQIEQTFNTAFASGSAIGKAFANGMTAADGNLLDSIHKLSSDRVVNGIGDVNMELSSYIEAFKSLYPGRYTNVYRIPITEKVGYGVQSEWSDADMMSSITGMFSGISTLKSFMNLMPINREMGQSWTGSSNTIDNVEINLINDTDENFIQNLRLIHGLNMAIRHSHQNLYRYSPNVFELKIPGFYWCPFVAVNNLTVASVGYFVDRKVPAKAIANWPTGHYGTTSFYGLAQQMGSFGGDSQFKAPQAYKLNVSFKELVMVSQELYAAGHGGSINGVTVVNKYIGKGAFADKGGINLGSASESKSSTATFEELSKNYKGNK
jgi:hypothetical protein